MRRGPGSPATTAVRNPPRPGNHLSEVPGEGPGEALRQRPGTGPARAAVPRRQAHTRSTSAVLGGGVEMGEAAPSRCPRFLADGATFTSAGRGNGGPVVQSAVAPGT